MIAIPPSRFRGGRAKYRVLHRSVHRPEPWGVASPVCGELSGLRFVSCCDCLRFARRGVTISTMSDPGLTLETESDLVNYIVAAGENGAVDAKAPMKWEDVQVKASLAHDIAAFANSEGGGAIVIGKSQLEDNTFELTGLNADESASFDTANVANWVNSRFEPPIDFTCYSVVHEKKTFVVIKAREFAEIPSICTKECTVEKKRLLECGALYVRTNSGSSTKLQTRDQLVALIARAVVKKQDQLREIFDRVLSGRSAENKPTDAAQFGVASASLFDQLQGEVGENSGLGGWEVSIHGERFERRWNTVAELM